MTFLQTRRGFFQTLFAGAVVAAVPTERVLVGPSNEGPRNPYPEPLLADDVTGTDAFAKWHAWEVAHGSYYSR